MERSITDGEMDELFALISRLEKKIATKISAYEKRLKRLEA